MENQIRIFESNEFGTVRTDIGENGSILFCASDVAKALGYSNPNKAINDHCRAITKRSTPISGKMQDINFIPESDVYRLAFSSRLPNAERFTDWVTEEVLPTIRKTGGYVNNADAFIENYLPMADENTKQLFRLTLNTVDQLNHKIREQNAQIERDAPDADFARRISKAPDTYSIGYLAKFLNANGYPTGKIRFFDQLRRDGYLGRSGSNYNQPMQKYCDSGLFAVQMTKVNIGDMEKFMPTTKVTGKGIRYFFRHYCAHGVKVSDNEIDRMFSEFSENESDVA